MKNELAVKPTKTDVAFAFDAFKFETEEDCIYAYKNAEAFYESKKESVISVVRSEALTKLYSLVFQNTDMFNKQPKDKREHFLDRLEELDLTYIDRGTRAMIREVRTMKRQVQYLLNFGKIRMETGILGGIKVTIPNSGQVRKLDSIYGKKIGTVDTIKKYDYLACKYNDEKPFKSALDLEAAAKLDYEVIVKAQNAVLEDVPKELEDDFYVGQIKGTTNIEQVQPKSHYVEKLTFEVETSNLVKEFFEANPNYTETKDNFRADDEVTVDFSGVTKKGFKLFVSEVSQVIHADTGGSDELQAILNAIRDGVKDSGIWKSREAEEYMTARTGAFVTFLKEKGKFELFEEGGTEPKYWLKG